MRYRSWLAYGPVLDSWNVWRVNRGVHQTSSPWWCVCSMHIPNRAGDILITVTFSEKWHQFINPRISESTDLYNTYARKWVNFPKASPDEHVLKQSFELSLTKRYHRLPTCPPSIGYALPCLLQSNSSPDNWLCSKINMIKGLPQQFKLEARVASWIYNKFDENGWNKSWTRWLSTKQQVVRNSIEID